MLGMGAGYLWALAEIAQIDPSAHVSYNWAD
jgi:hypothetical protein